MCDYVVRRLGTWKTNEPDTCGHEGHNEVGKMLFCGVHMEMMSRELLHGIDQNEWPWVVNAQDALVSLLVHNPKFRARVFYDFRELWEQVQESDAEQKRQKASTARAAKIARESRVYFVERDGFVKIGVTTNLEKRLQSLARGGALMPAGMTIGPITVLATMRGTRANEAYLHKRFAHLRIEGEWFLLDETIHDFIANLGCNRERVDA